MLPRLSLLTILLVTLNSYAQKGGFQKEMKRALMQLDTIEVKDSYLLVSNRFERIAQVEKSQWLPYYYAAFCQVNLAFEEQDLDQVDYWCNKANHYLELADSLSPNNSEIYCLKAMVASARIKVDFMSRGIKYSTLSNQYLQKAIALNKENPRAYFLMGQNIYNTPEPFGGGKDKASPVFKTSVEMYKKEKVKALSPSWGEETATAMLQACQG